MDRFSINPKMMRIFKILDYEMIFISGRDDDRESDVCLSFRQRGYPTHDSHREGISDRSRLDST